jgi:competence ComEA-like helix-hairpin-helix protein
MAAIKPPRKTHRASSSVIQSADCRDCPDRPVANWRNIMRRPFFVISTLSLAAVLFGAAVGDDLPAGDGKDAVLKMCTNCHELGQVTSAKYPKKFWESVVDDMVSRGAEGTDEEVNSVINYLSRNFGKPRNINTSTAKEIEAGLSFTAAESELIVRYRADKGAFKTYEDLLKVPDLDAKLLDEQKKNILF